MERKKESNKFSQKASKAFGENNSKKRFLLKEYFDILQEIDSLNKTFFYFAKSRKNLFFSENNFTLLKKALLLYYENLEVFDEKINFRNFFINEFLLLKEKIKEHIEDLNRSLIKKVIFEKNRIELALENICKFLLERVSDWHNITGEEILKNNFRDLHSSIDSFQSEANRLNLNISNHKTDEELIVPLDSEKKSSPLTKFSKYINGRYSYPDWQKFLRTAIDLYEIEINCDSCWIITPDFWYELDNLNHKFSEVLKNNVIQKKEIRYFYPSDMKYIAKPLESKYNKICPNNNVTFHELPELANIFKFIDYEIVLYDPTNKNSKNHQGFYVDFFKFKCSPSVVKSASVVHITICEETMEKLISYIKNIILKN